MYGDHDRSLIFSYIFVQYVHTLTLYMCTCTCVQPAKNLEQDKSGNYRILLC
jgi:hypothetical protein